jgi:hypothetical protein
MDSDPIKKSVLRSAYLGVILAPFLSAFVIAAILAGGPSEVYKALRDKKRDG